MPAWGQKRAFPCSAALTQTLIAMMVLRCTRGPVCQLSKAKHVRLFVYFEELKRVAIQTPAIISANPKI